MNVEKARTDLAKAFRLGIGSGSAIDFRLIPAGEFPMGAKGYSDNEEPVHRVQLGRAYYLGTYPVTQEQFRCWTETGAYTDWLARAEEQGRVEERHRNYFDGEGTEHRPAERVTWYEAVGYCEWLEARVREQLGVGWTARLPSEAEWERACRGGSDREYCLGDGEGMLARVGWYAENSNERTHDVGEIGVGNDFGLYDTHGNVAEWCLDAWSPSAYQKRHEGAMAPVMTESNCGWKAEDDPAVARFRNWTRALEKLFANEQLAEDMVNALEDLTGFAVSQSQTSWKELRPRLERWCRTRMCDSDDHNSLEILLAWTQPMVTLEGEIPRVVRGGSRNCSARYCRSAFRDRGRPGGRFDTVGFRVCLVRGPAASQPEQPARRLQGGAGAWRRRPRDEA